ncbi:MAG: hypothetical protein RL538_69 [Candidatus Parcubacteria bacterium]|jgi:uncharacterized membrane protein (UPF0127 family)
MKIAERIVMVCIVLALVGGGVWLYFSVQYKRQAVRDAVARGEYEIRPDENKKEEDVFALHYPELIPIALGSTTVSASVADSMPERIKGLSGTPYLPEGVVKLFAFGTEGEHSIWMKDMNYPIDIIWVAKEGEIVHIEERISPETYPNSFASPTPAWYVIEANAGFVASSSIKKGDEVVVSGR